MKDNELQIIEQLTGASSDQIRLADDGFWSRGYVIDNGRIVFKFKKSPEVRYEPEIKALKFVSSLGLGINVQKVGWVSPDDSYLGIYGVVGQSLDSLPNPDYRSIGSQLASVLQKLHQAHPEGAEVFTLDKELSAWQERYQKSHNKLSGYFSDEEIARLDEFMFETIPTRLKELGEKIVYSHGDLGDGNIFIDDEGKVGIIDFSEMCYFDEAGDFMDVSSDELRTAMLDAYGADDVLREKVRLRVLVRPLIVFGDYARRGNIEKVKQLVDKMKGLLEGETMTKSKGWNWSMVKGDHADFWRTPSIESFYLVSRWQDLGFKDFLDLGCGLGRHAILFGKNNFNVSCFDISEEAIAKTKKWATSENLTFDYQVGDMLKLPYADTSFDAILCRDVISHTDTAGMKKTVSELWRVLRPGGECYLTLGSKNTWGWKETNWPKLDENTKLRQDDGPEDGVPHFYADYNLIKELFAKFKIINLYQLEEFGKNRTERKVYESWHYHVLIRKLQK